MIRKIWLGAGLLALAWPAVGQTCHHKGFVLDSRTGESIPGAHLFLPQAQMGGVSNSYGYYSLPQVPCDTFTVCATAIGYGQRCLAVSGGDSLYRLALDPVSLALEEVEIVGSAADSYASSPHAPMRVEGAKIRFMPHLGAEADPMKALHSLPGIQQGQEGNAGVYVRGGTPDQNLILLDGVPVYNTSHLFGLLSVFNADAIRDMKVYVSDIPAKYGERLSSVIDIQLREGNTREVKGSWSISPMVGTLMVEGPVRKGKSSFIVSARKTWIDAFLSLLQANSNIKAKVLFHDFAAKYNHEGRWGHFYWSLYHNRDGFRYRESFSGGPISFMFGWGNTTSVMRWAKPLGSRVFASASASYSRYTLGYEASYKPTGNVEEWGWKVDAITEDLMAKAQLEWYPAPGHEVNAGVSHAWQEFVPASLELRSSDSVEARYQGYQRIRVATAYLSDQWTPARWATVYAGIRCAAFGTGGKLYPSAQPRLSATVRMPKGWEAGLSYVAMVQFQHLLHNTLWGQPTDLWVPSTAQTPPQRARQLSFGFTKKWGKKIISTINTYIKHTRDVVAYREDVGQTFGLAQDWETQVTSGQASGYGIEVAIRKSGEVLSGDIAYTFARVFQQFDEINRGKRFPFVYDRPHSLSVNATIRLGKERTLTALLSVQSGRLLSLSQGYYPTLPPSIYQGSTGTLVESFGQVPWYNSRNNFRFPMYHRLDINYTTARSTRKGNKRSWIFSIYNVYSQLNPYFIYSIDGELKQYALFPILPAVGYRIEW